MQNLEKTSSKGYGKASKAETGSKTKYPAFAGIVEGAKTPWHSFAINGFCRYPGKNIDEGIGIGFDKSMNTDCGQDMQKKPFPAEFEINSKLKAGPSDIVAGKRLYPPHRKNFYNNTEKDIERLAYEFEFYRKRLSLARGGA